MDVYSDDFTSHLYMYEYSKEKLRCGNWNQDKSEDVDNDLNEDRRSVYVNRKISPVRDVLLLKTDQ